ncbi:MAG: glycoside hydrolase family 32 protein, partial [Chloroflexia bacterium]
GFRDHCIWKEGDTWYQIIGSGITGKGGTALLYRSSNLLNWDYLHPLFLADTTAFPQLATAYMYECPDFFPLAAPDSNMMRYILNLSVMDDTPIHYSAYLAGTYSQDDHIFSAEQFHRLDYGPSFYAPQTFRDESGRRIMFGWLREARSEDAQRAAGWSGMMSIPRVLTLRHDGMMSQQPAPELEMLRGRHMSHIQARGTSITPDDSIEWHNDAVEIIAEFDLMDAAEAGISVRCSADEREQTRIFYDRVGQQLVVDTTLSSLDPTLYSGSYSGPLTLAQGEKLHLHIFVDHSIVEVFANDRTCITGRIYPTLPDTMGINIIVNGGRTNLLSLDVWELNSIWGE